MQREGYGEIVDLAVAQNATTSASFQIPRWATFVGVYVPDLDAGDLTVHISKDDSTFIPVADITDGDDHIVVASGKDPLYMDLSPLLASVPKDWYGRFVMASQTSAAVTLTVSFRP